MHSRFDTASLHAACTSVSEAHDNALTLQTDWGMFSRKKDHPMEEGMSAKLSRYFTRDFFAARPKFYPTAPGGRINGHKYGILTRHGRKHYFQVQDYESAEDEKTLKNVGVKQCYDSITQPVEFDDKGPIKIWDWPYIWIWPDEDVVYIRNPEEYFDQRKLKTQNKWPIQMPDKKQIDHPQSIWKRMWATPTSARTNPYLVRRVGAATALDPDVSLQTDAWPRLRMPNVRQEKKFQESCQYCTLMVTTVRLCPTKLSRLLWMK